MVKSYSEILYIIKKNEKEYNDALEELDEKILNGDKDAKNEIKRKMKRINNEIKYYQNLVDKLTTFKKTDFLKFLKAYLNLLDNGVFASIEDSGKEKHYDDDYCSSESSSTAYGLSTMAIGMSVGNPGLQLNGLNNLLWSGSKSVGKGSSVIEKKVHLAKGVKLKEKYTKYPLFGSVFTRLINLALINPSLSPVERLNKILEEEKVRRLTGRHL